MTRMLSLAHLTAIDLSPPDLIHEAARAGFDAVGLRLIRVTDTSPGYPLMRNPKLMKETKAALRETGLLVHDIEFVKIEPNTDIDALLPFLDAGAELGAREVITAPYDPDQSRLADRLAELDEKARERGIGISFEFFPWTVVPDLKAALTVVTQAGPKIGILVDALHFDRSSSSHQLLADLPRNRLRFAHLCDAPVSPPYSNEDLLFAGRDERLPPGAGQIDLVSFLRSLPTNIPLGLEVPMTRRTEEEGNRAVIQAVFAGARHVVAGLSEQAPDLREGMRS